MIQKENSSCHNENLHSHNPKKVKQVFDQMLGVCLLFSFNCDDVHHEFSPTQVKLLSLVLHRCMVASMGRHPEKW
jgi:hypothetical protein